MLAPGTADGRVRAETVADRAVATVETVDELAVAEVPQIAAMTAAQSCLAAPRVSILLMH